MLVAYLIVLAVGYLLGALPFGHLVARAKGVNIFEVGSRNPGATNVRRVLGKGPGNLVFALDALKGAVASAWALLARTEAVFTCEMPEWGLDFMVGGEGWTLLGVAGLVGAMLGHSFSCFTKFKGGKGVATGAGGIFVIIPVSALIAAAVWALVFFAFRYVSLASMLAALSLPLTVWLRDRPPLVITLTALITLFVIFRHRENIKRLLNGTENRFVKKSPEEPKA
jgi:glycerol-3-phosphate acyltransferase PlsY